MKQKRNGRLISALLLPLLLTFALMAGMLLYWNSEARSRLAQEQRGLTQQLLIERAAHTRTLLQSRLEDAARSLELFAAGDPGGDIPAVLNRMRELFPPSEGRVYGVSNRSGAAYYTDGSVGDVSTLLCFRSALAGETAAGWDAARGLLVSAPLSVEGQTAGVLLCALDPAALLDQNDALLDENGDWLYGESIHMQAPDNALTVADNFEAGGQVWQLVCMAIPEETESLPGLFPLLVVLALTLTLLTACGMSCVRVLRQNQQEKHRTDSEAELLRLALTALSAETWTLDLRTSTLTGSTNPAGQPRQYVSLPDSLIDSGLICPESAETLREAYQSLLDGERTVETVLRVRDAALGFGYRRLYFMNLFNSAGLPYKAVGVTEDVTDRQEDAIRYRTAADRKPAMLCGGWVDLGSGVLAEATVPAQAILPDPVGGDASAAVSFEGTPDAYIRLLCGEQPVPFTLEALCAAHENGEQTRQYAFRRRLGDGSLHWVELTAAFLRHPDTRRRVVLLTLQPIDDRMRETEQLRLMSRQDALTGLYHRTAAIAVMGEAIRDRRPGETYAMLLVDLDGFRQVVGSFGNSVGDETVLSVASILRNASSPNDLLGRMGADTFLVLLRGVDPAVLPETARALCTSLQFSFQSGRDTVRLSASIGAALLSDGQDFDSLYRVCDAAVMRCKQAGGCRFEVAEDAQSRLSDDRTFAVQLDSVLESIDGGVVLIRMSDPPRLLYISPGYYTSVSLSPAGSYQELVADILPADRKRLRDALKEAAAGDEPADMIFRVRDNGELCWRHIRAVRVPYSKAEAPVLSAIITDVTRLRSLEEGLSLREKTAAAALKLAGKEVWQLEIASCRLLLGDRPPVNGTPDGLLSAGLIHAQSAEGLHRLYADMQAGYEGGVYLLLTREGWVTTRFSLLREEDGSVRRAVGGYQPCHDPEQLADELRCGQLLHRRMEGFCSTALISLTREQVESCRFAPDLLLPDPADMPTPNGLFHRLLRRAEFKDEYRRLETMTPAALLVAYDQGIRTCAVSYRRRDDSGRVSWYRLHIRLARDFAAGDTYAFAALCRIDARRASERGLLCRAVRDADEVYDRPTFQLLCSARLRDASARGELAVLAFHDTTPGSEPVPAHLKTARELAVPLLMQHILCQLDDASFAVLLQPQPHRTHEQAKDYWSSLCADLAQLCRRSGLPLTCTAGVVLCGGKDAGIQPDVSELLAQADALCRQTADLATPWVRVAEPE